MLLWQDFPTDGEGLYNVACASCHGATGQGDGAAGAALTECSPANFTDPAFWEERDMDRIVNVITNGAVAVGGCSLMVSRLPRAPRQRFLARTLARSRGGGGGHETTAGERSSMRVRATPTRMIAAARGGFRP